MQLQTGRDLSESLFGVLGYCSNTERVRIGSLAENTHPQVYLKLFNIIDYDNHTLYQLHPQIKEEIRDMLTSDDLGFSEAEARSVIDKSWSDTPENMRIKTTGDLQQIFSDLKVTGMNIFVPGRTHILDTTRGEKN